MFGTFVDRALFGRGRGYYGSGRVQFGDDGHFDTFPTALSPVFGRVVAERAYALWWEGGRPPRFEIFEIGAGDGQLALDVLCHVGIRGRRSERRAAFARALRYVICERSPALVRRQQERVRGLPLAANLSWVGTDLLRPGAVRRARQAAGFVIANEVLDCLPHERIVGADDREARATWVTRRGAQKTWRFVPHEGPVAECPTLAAFLERFRPEILGRDARPRDRRATGARRSLVYFACPVLVPFLGNVAALYGEAEIWLIDYGRTDLHRRGVERGKVWIGPPHRGRAPDPARIFAHPGCEDISFLVDFEVVARVAEAAGLDVELLDAQGALAERAGVEVGNEVCEEIVRQRVMRWCLSLIGAAGAAGRWSGAIGFGRRGIPLRDDVSRALAEFRGERPSLFRGCVLVRRPRDSRRGARSRARAGPPHAPGGT